MLNSISAELLLLRKRPSTWVLLGLWTLLAANFGYIFSYVAYLNGSGDSVRPLADMLPSRLVATLLEGYPFFGGVIVLILGVLTFGGEYGWGTLKTVYTQGPKRSQVLAAKIIALGIVLTSFVIVPFLVGALLSYGIALREDEAIDWPSVSVIARGLAAGWFLMVVWAAFGAVLAVLSRGTALAIGLGILYGLVIEGLLSAFVNDISVLRPVTEAFLRSNGYSLVEPLGLATEQVRGNGPGAFRGPYVSGLQAFSVLAAYFGAFVVLTGFVLRKQEVA